MFKSHKLFSSTKPVLEWLVVGISKFWFDSLGIRFWNFCQFFEIAWAAPRSVSFIQNITQCVNLITPVIFIYNIRDIYFILPQPTQFQPTQFLFFGRFFHLKSYVPHLAPGRNWYQKMGILLRICWLMFKSLPGDAHLLKRPRKNLKIDYRCSVHRKLVRA